MKSSLYRHQLSQPLTQDELLRYEIRLWREKGKVIVDPLELDSFTKQEIINYANRKYGKR